MEIPRRPQSLAVALPASFTRDVPHLREKTGRIGLIARALAIFRVDRAIIYNDRADSQSIADGKLLEKLLAYQETPQYLRRALFPRDPDLQFAGTLPPLRLPSHPDRATPNKGEIRDAVVIESGATSLLNAGFDQLVNVDSRLNRLGRVTVQLTRTSPHLEGKLVDPGRLPIYWGFKVTRTDFKLGELVKREKKDLTISTSRRGRSILEVMNELRVRWTSARQLLVLFGSPNEGVPEILARERVPVDTIADYNLNTIPNQGVETVRSEEAVFATLSELNILENS